jgi:hypothetical protein
VTPLVSEVVDLDDVPAALGRLERGESVKVLTAISRQKIERIRPPSTVRTRPVR